ncbi:acetamidase/formamidase family protein [Roseateles sp. GG27B]
MAKYGIKNPIFKPSPITPHYNDYLIFEGISVDESGKQYYLDVNVAYRQACLNAIEYLKKFGYSGAQAYSILGTAPVQGHISGVVDVPNACATLWLPTQIFDFASTECGRADPSSRRFGGDAVVTRPHLKGRVLFTARPPCVVGRVLGILTT